jgi:anti-sigma factor RsiW
MEDQQHCKELLGTLSDYVDGTLSRNLCLELERHLKDCVNCRVVVNTLKKTIELYQSDTEKSPLPEDVRKRLFYRLDLGMYLNHEDS